jgi:hypothetical protein
MATEIENALGGVYSIFSEEFQRPLVELVKARLEKRGDLPKLKDDLLKTVLITGLDALGRNQDLMRLDTFVGGMLEKFGPAAAQYINIGDYMTRRATALGIDTKGLIRSQQEVQRDQQQAQQAAMMQAAVPNAVKAIGDSAVQTQQQGTGEQ